jgi:hypothetical protein
VWAEYFRLIRVSAYHENRKERSTFSVITTIEHDGNGSEFVHLIWGYDVELLQQQAFGLPHEALASLEQN